MIIPSWYLEEVKYKYNFHDIDGTKEEPKTALKKQQLGPYSKDFFRTTRVGFMLICPEKYKGPGERFYKAFQNGFRAHQAFSSIFIRACTFESPNFFHGEHTAQNYQLAVQDSLRRLSRTKADIWICFVVIEDGFKQLPTLSNPYFTTRAILLSNQILVQCLTKEKLSKSDSELQWILDSIAVQCYAKLGGTPWTIAPANSEPEIVIGVGEARVSGNENDERIFGFTTIFNQNGAYLTTEYGQPVVGFQNYVASLPEKVRGAINEYVVRENQRPKRLILHLYKPPGKRTEVFQIERVMSELNSEIEYAILHIDVGTDFRVFDSTDSSLKPEGRLAIYVDDYQRLVVLSGREISWIPPRVALMRLSPKSTYRDLNSLTQQAYEFTKVHWAGLQPNNVPVTLKYPRELARMYSNLELLGPDGEWYGKITQSALRDKTWFI